MPSTLNYPGVYIEEIPSGVRTITGVATSITAFIGRALRGPTDEDPESPVVITSFGDFERIFGGLWLGSTLGYAVHDFFLNGGSKAVIVRLHNKGTKAEIALPTGSPAPDDFLKLASANVGSWGNRLKVIVDYKTKNDKDTKLFNLTVNEVDETATPPQIVNSEKFLNVSIDPNSPRYVPRALEDGSELVRTIFIPKARPTATLIPLTPTSGTSATTTGDDGSALLEANFTGSGMEGAKKGLFNLAKTDLFNLLCIPPYQATGDVEPSVIVSAAAYSTKRRAFLLIDPPTKWTSKDKAVLGIEKAEVGATSKNAAVFFPRLRQPNPLRENQVEEFVPCGAVAGVFARTDAQRGVWKAPAGTEAALLGVPELSVPLNDAENGELNPLGVNCLRTMPAVGRVVWGARTREGDDRLASEWKYIPVRRTALFIEESLYRATQWVVFEPNDEPLWAQIRLNIGSFMHNLFRQGAFQGKTPNEAYFVKCDKETTTQTDINLGIVNIVVGFAPLKPAEFVVIKIQQMAGQIAT
jgi:phage tail sheath protein FI